MGRGGRLEGTCEHYVKWVVHVPRLLQVTIQKAIYLIRKAPCSPCGTFLWSSISAKNRSLYSILDLLYFMLPYTMRHPTVFIRGLTFRLYMVLFVFHIQYHEFGMPN